ncbi:hypothetical protein OC844_002504 [Tilletia horrida]|nr:hypothetical protein OC844_002504 [Tilletia horrida]
MADAAGDGAPAAATATAAQRTSVLTARAGQHLHHFRRIYLGPSPVTASKAVSVALTLAQAESYRRMHQAQAQAKVQLDQPELDEATPQLQRAETRIPLLSVEAGSSADNTPAVTTPAVVTPAPASSSPRVRRIGLPPEAPHVSQQQSGEGTEDGDGLLQRPSGRRETSSKRRGRIFRDRSDASFASNVSFQSARSMPSSVLSEPVRPQTLTSKVDSRAESQPSSEDQQLQPSTSKDKGKHKARGRSHSQSRSRNRSRSRSRSRGLISASSNAKLDASSNAVAGSSTADGNTAVITLQPGAVGTSAGGTKWVGATFDVGSAFHEVASRRRDRIKELEQQETRRAQQEAEERKNRSSIFLVLNDDQQPLSPVSPPRSAVTPHGTFIGHGWLPANPITEHDEDDVAPIPAEGQGTSVPLDQRRPSDVIAAFKAVANHDSAQRSREASGTFDDPGRPSGSNSAVPNVNFDLPKKPNGAEKTGDQNGHIHDSPMLIPWPSSRRGLPGSGTSTAMHSEEHIPLQRMDNPAPNSRAEKDPTVSRKTILKRDRMLVKEDWTPDEDLPPDYDELAARRFTIHSDKWRELLVVLRMRRVELWQESRVHRKKRVLKLRTSIPLYSSETHLSVYSKADNIFCLTFEPSRRRALSGKGLVHLRRTGTNIILFNPRYASAAIDWMWEIWRELGGVIPAQIDVHMPTLDLHVRLPVPDEVPEREAAMISERLSTTGALLLHSHLARQHGHAEPGHEGYKLINRQSVIGLVVQLVEAEPQLRDMLDWLMAGGLQLELAWRRGNTLDWIIQDMTVDFEPRCWALLGGAMFKKPNSKSVLELRAAVHEHDHVRNAKGEKIEEPPAIEGFLWRVRPVSNTLDRIYLSTHDGHIFICRPSRAFPPDRHMSGPGLGALDLRVPRTDAYSLPGARRRGNASVEYDNEHVSRRTRARRAFEILFGRTQTMKREDEMAAFRAQVLDLLRYPGETEEELEAQDRLFQTWQRRRQFEQIDGADGYVDLRDIYAVRTVAESDGTLLDALKSSDILDLVQKDIGGEEGMSASADKNLLRKLRQFEVTHTNGRSIRVEAYSASLARQWIDHLNQLKDYWKRKERLDAILHMQVEGSFDPSQLGEKAQRAMAEKRLRNPMSEAERISPLLTSLWNWCIVEGCRGIIRSGKLFHKRSAYAPYERGYFILIGGRLLGYALSTSERTSRARQNAGIFWRRRSEAGGMRTIPLRDAYIVSGRLTDDFRGASNHGSFEGGAKTPAGSLGCGTGAASTGERHTLPRVYADGMISTDEDEDCTFVIRYRKQSQDRPSALPNAVKPLRKIAERSAAAAAALFAEDDKNPIAAHLKRRATERLEKMNGASAAGAGEGGSNPIDPATLPRMRDLKNVEYLVMRARSRLEKELWVWAIRLEMERLVREDAERDEALREMGVLEKEGDSARFAR